MTGPQMLTYPNPDGSQAQFTVGYAYAPAPPPPTPMLIGTDQVAVPAGGAYSRRFAGNAIPSIDSVPAACTPHISTGTVVPDRATMQAWLAHNAGRHGYITVKHEVNTAKKGTPTQFKADMLALAQAVDPHLVDWPVVEIFALYAEVYADRKTPPIPHWQAYHSPVASYVGWDCYRDPVTTAYPAPADFFAPVIACRDATGLPFMVPELGSTQLPSDPSGSGLADWYAGCVDYLRGEGCVAVAAWATIGSQFDYTLTGIPLWAWTDRMAHQADR